MNRQHISTRPHGRARRFSFLRAGFLPIAALALAAGACDDPTDVEEHAAADGFAIVTGGAEIYRWMLDEGAPSPLSLAVGAHDVAFVLLDGEGDPLPHEEHEAGEEEEQLIVTIGDAGVLTWEPEAETGEAHTHLEFHGTLNALVEGTTTLGVCLEHGEHCDFGTPETAPVAVTITSP